MRSLSPWGPSWPAILVLLLSAFLAAGCAGGEDSSASADGSTEESADAKNEGEEGEEEKEDEAVPVDVAVIGRGSIEAILRSSATLEAENQVGVFSEAARRVERILVEEGDVVAKGKVLLQLQSAEQRSALARVESQLAKAQSEFDRQLRLHEQGLTTDKAYTDATYELEQQRIAVADAKRELAYTQVRAPIGGTITSRLVSVGDQVQVQQQVFEIVDFESLVARIYVPEKDLKQLADGQQARVTARAIQDEPYAGRILRIAPVVDPRSGTVKVTVAVGGQAGLRPGLFVDVELVTAVHGDALLVPKRALVYDNDLVFVYRVKSGKAERQQIMPLLSDKDFIEPAAGVAMGDTIIVAGQTGLKDGARVELAGQGDEASGGDTTVVDGDSSPES